MARFMDMGDCRQALLDVAPEQVGFVAIERLEKTASYMCYYAVRLKLQEGRERPDWDWRRAYITPEMIEAPKLFWETQPAQFPLRAGTDDGRWWIESQIAAYEALEPLLHHWDLYDETVRALAEAFKFPADMGVVTLSPEELERRPQIVRDLLMKHLQIPT